MPSLSLFGVCLNISRGTLLKKATLWAGSVGEFSSCLLSFRSGAWCRFSLPPLTVGADRPIFGRSIFLISKVVVVVVLLLLRLLLILLQPSRPIMIFPTIVFTRFLGVDNHLLF